jgi:hypothetical protein
MTKDLDPTTPGARVHVPAGSTGASAAAPLAADAPTNACARCGGFEGLIRAYTRERREWHWECRSCYVKATIIRAYVNGGAQ